MFQIKILLKVFSSLENMNAFLLLNKDQHGSWALPYHGNAGNCGVDYRGSDDQNMEGGLQFVIQQWRQQEQERCDDSQCNERQGDVEKDVVHLTGTKDHIVVSFNTPTGDEIDEDVREGEEDHHVGEGED